MEDRAGVTKRYPSCYHLRSFVLLSEPEMEAAVSPPASRDPHSPYLRIAAEAGSGAPPTTRPPRASVCAVSSRAPLAGL